MSDALSLFHPTVASWFTGHFASPTRVQMDAWPVIARGDHALVTAPTGSGKTLTAFLWALNRFAVGDWQPGRTRVLYISPLKALNNDIQTNLLEPLAELTTNYNFPAITVRTRSGDTSQGDRQRMLRHPPDILITTPESLSLLLTTSRGRMALSTVECVIADEVHAIVENRRGVQLMTSFERLVRLSGEFQRIALSATVRPLDAVAAYVGGFTEQGHARPVTIVDAPQAKEIVFRVRFPEAARDAAQNGKKIWDPLGDSFKEVIKANRSTLFFTNSRRLAEKITLKINEGEMQPVAYAHHGSLARDIRVEVETRMKSGELKAIVATNSLEMGIDVGALDEVILVQSPPSIASTLQRVGRAGHRVNDVSTGTLYPSHAHDFLEAAALAQSIDARDIEPLQLLTNPLDVLVQIVVSICATDPWPVDKVFDLVRSSTPYRELPRQQFDLLIDMLAGRYAASRVRELKPRLTYDRLRGTIEATRGAVLSMYNSGGTIPDRGYYQLRHADTGAALGELDEEFVWEATTGQTFTLGTHNWQIQRITHNDVLVRSAKRSATAPPFWRAESMNRSVHFSQAVNATLSLAELFLADGNAQALKHELVTHRHFDECAADELVDYLDRQRQATGTPLPSEHHLLIEHVASGPAGYQGPDAPQQLVFHTLWGGRVNRPWALALEAEWRQRYASRPDIHADNNTVVIQCKEMLDPVEVLGWVTPENVDALLRKSLEHSGYFGARFRECAGRSLLLTRQRFNQRLPLWMSRLQAKKLMKSVQRFSDFPILLETWRTCLKDEFDLPALNRLLNNIATGAIAVSTTHTRTPSPFAANVTFTQVSRYMYANDSPESPETSALDNDLIAAATHIAALRPRIRPEVIAEFVAKRQRTAPGYAPRDNHEWAEWVKERVLIPSSEWSVELADATGSHPDLHVFSLGERRWVAHLEAAHAMVRSGMIPHAARDSTEALPALADPRDATAFALEILSFYGPLTAAQIEALLPCVPKDLLEEMPSETASIDVNLIPLISGQLIDHGAGVDGPNTWCDAANFESLLRFQRAGQRPMLEPQPVTALPAFWHRWQGLDGAKRADGPHIAPDEVLGDTLERLAGYADGVSTWLNDLLPPRCGEVTDAAIDAALKNRDLTWIGTGKEAMTVCFPDEIEWFQPSSNTTEDANESDSEPVDAGTSINVDIADESLAPHFADPSARYEFLQIADASGSNLADLNDIWWQSIWAGRLAADSVTPLREGMARRYLVMAASASRHAGGRPSRRHGSRVRGWSGYWRLLPHKAGDIDALSQLDDDKERTRVLLDRYGVVNREIVNREWQWRRAFRALRLMELGGEVVQGYFFTDLSGPQFALPRTLASFASSTPPEHSTRSSDKPPAAPDTFWMSARDPASICGLALSWPNLQALPHRRAGNYLSFCYRTDLPDTAATGHVELALVITANGKRLQYQVPPEHPSLDAINAPLVRLAHQQRSLTIDTINGEAVSTSPYLEALSRVLKFYRDHAGGYFRSR